MESKKNKSANLENRRSMFLMMGLVTSLLLMITAFEWRFYDDQGLVDLGKITDDFQELLEIPITEQPPPPPPKVIQPEIIEIPDDEIIEEEIPVDLDIEVTENDIIEMMIDEPDAEPEDPEKIFLIVEKEAKPDGGYAAFYKFIYDNIKYPRQARKMGIEGKVFVQFVVEKDGSISDAVILKGIGFGCDQETLRVIRNAPPWHPGKQRGVPVRVRMALSVNFALM